MTPSNYVHTNNSIVTNTDKDDSRAGRMRGINNVVQQHKTEVSFETGKNKVEPPKP